MDPRGCFQTSDCFSYFDAHPCPIAQPYRKDAGRKLENPIAKATHNKSRRNWKVFWQRADLKRHGYEPHLEAASIEEFLDVIKRDDHAVSSDSASPNLPRRRGKRVIFGVVTSAFRNV